MIAYEFGYDLFAFMMISVFFGCVCFGCARRLLLESKLQIIDVETPPTRYSEDKPPDYSEV